MTITKPFLHLLTGISICAIATANAQHLPTASGYAALPDNWLLGNNLHTRPVALAIHIIRVGIVPRELRRDSSVNAEGRIVNSAVPREPLSS